MIRRLIRHTPFALMVLALGVRPADAQQGSPPAETPAAPRGVIGGLLPDRGPAPAAEPEPDDFDDLEPPPRPLGDPAAEPEPFEAVVGAQDPVQLPVPAAEAPAPFPVDAPYDDRVERVQAPDDPNLPPATLPPGGADVSAGAAAGAPFSPPVEQIKPGPNDLGVSIEVVAPQVINLNRDEEVRLVVRNTGPAEATNVRVRYVLPEGVEYLSFEGAGASLVSQDPYVWQIASLPTGVQKIIKVKVRYREEGQVDHVASFTVQGAAKARTQARQPKLKVEVRPSANSVLKGSRVTFDITVSNAGTHPARDVIVTARLGAGLEYPPLGRDLRLPLKDEGIQSLAPGEMVGPLKLEVDTKSMGEQTCVVAITSPDLPGEVTAECVVLVVEPRLEVRLDGPPSRHPDSIGLYTLSVTNTGTAPALDVMSAIKIPNNATPRAAMPEGAIWKRDRRTLYWQERELPPGERREYQVEVRMGPVGSLEIAAGARAQGTLESIAPKLTTQVVGVARLICTLDESRGVLDEGEETDFHITLTNDGTRDAENVQVKAKFSENLQVVSVTGIDGKAQEPQAPPEGTAVLPVVERIRPGEEVTLTVRARAVKEGNGTCQAALSYNDSPEELIRASVITRVTPPSTRR